MEQKKIDRINELAKKSRSEEGLTEVELKEQQRLRQEYVAAFRNNMESVLGRVRIVEKDGSMTELKKKKGTPS